MCKIKVMCKINDYLPLNPGVLMPILGTYRLKEVGEWTHGQVNEKASQTEHCSVTSWRARTAWVTLYPSTCQDSW